MQLVINLVRRSLRDLQLAIQGSLILNQTLVDTMNAIFDGRVPDDWIAISWSSANLSTWFADFLRREMQYRTWLWTAPPAVYWLTGFFNAQGFITAMKQETTRAHNGQWAIDSLEMRCDVLHSESPDGMVAPEDGVLIHGLFLEGCGWASKGGKLVDSEPKVLFVPMPVIHLTAVSGGNPSSRNYLAPVYRTPGRKDLIFTVELRTDEPPQRWTLRGVCLCTRTDM